MLGFHWRKRFSLKMAVSCSHFLLGQETSAEWKEGLNIVQHGAFSERAKLVSSPTPQQWFSSTACRVAGRRNSTTKVNKRRASTSLTSLQFLVLQVAWPNQKLSSYWRFRGQCSVSWFNKNPFSWFLQPNEVNSFKSREAGLSKSRFPWQPSLASPNWFQGHDIQVCIPSLCKYTVPN